MLLIIDANVVFAAVLSPQGITRNLLFSPRLELISPEFLEEEIKKHFPTLLAKFGGQETDLRLALDLIISQIKIRPSVEYAPYREKASKFSPDPNDTEYLALALAFGCPIWSYDKRLGRQHTVKVLSTVEVLNLLR